MNLLGSPASAQSNWPTPQPVDAARLERQGLRALEGEHITLVTDLPSDAEVDALPRVFDAAVPRWAERFGVDPADLADWRVLACLIGDRERFRAAGLLPDGGESFPHGLSKGHRLWAMEQDTAYYRRHLLLHEGTHSFMATRLGGCGPGWYMEGMAELLGMHAWDPATGDLALGLMLPDGHDARSVGRVGSLRDAVGQKQALAIGGVIQIDNARALPNRSYAWVWALAKFLDTHPRYQQRFRELQAHVRAPDFNERFQAAYAADWDDLSLEWRLFITTLQYGHDIPREAIDFQNGQPLASTARSSLTITANHGWQSTGILLEANHQYRVDAQGMVTLAVEPANGPEGRPVESTAGGITLDYHNGRPLGVLLAAIDPRGQPGQAVPPTAKGGLLNPAALGSRARFRAPFTGTLYLRVNDAPAGLADNGGQISVSLSAAGSSAD